MANHDTVHITNELPKHCQFILIEFFSGAIDLRQLIVSVCSCSRVTGEMFAAARDPLPSHSGIEYTSIAHDLLDIFSVAPAAQRILSVIIKGDVQHRTKIQIEPEKAQQTSGDLAMAPNQVEVILVAQLLRARRLTANQAQSRHTPAFLVDGNDRLDVAEVAQIIDKLSELRRTLDVACEKNKGTRLDASKQGGRFRIDFLARHTGHDQLTKRIVLHRSQR